MRTKNGKLLMHDILEDYKKYLIKVYNMFKVLENPKNIDYGFFRELCCDFKLLEEKCVEYHKKD